MRKIYCGTSGSNEVPSTHKLSEVPVSVELLKAVLSFYGSDLQLRPAQDEAVFAHDLLTDDRNAIIATPTNSGKSLLSYLLLLNSAIEVDLLGQAVADMIGSRQFTGVGGFTDFVRGAGRSKGRSKGGRSILAFASTSKDGKTSRIVPHITEGAAVAATRYDTNYVVTEYGAAQLWGKTNRERVEALIGIAHPKFRDELRAYAHEKGLIW